MSIKEYRIVLPVSVEEYQVGQLYAVAEASKNETGGGEGVEVKFNEPYEKDGEKGQYTHKVYHLDSKVPRFVRGIVPTGYLTLEEKAWNAYPKCRTVLQNPSFKGFEIEICTMHVNDMGEQENVYLASQYVKRHCLLFANVHIFFTSVHGPDKKTVSSNDIINIDIADNNAISPKDYKAEHDPSKYKSEKTGRGPLGPDWKKELANNPNCPHMCAYKLVTIKCPWYLKMLPSVVIQMETRVFTHFHRQLFCWLDKWIDLTMDDIRRIEEETKKELDDMRSSAEIKGMGACE